MPGWHQGVRIKGARPRLILASPGDTRRRRQRLWSPGEGGALLLARGAQGCRTPSRCPGQPLRESLLHISGAGGHETAAPGGVCEDALGGVSAQHVSQVCVSAGSATHGAHVPGEPVCECGCVSGFIPWTRWERRLGRQTWRRPDRRAETRCWVCFTRGQPAPSLGPCKDLLSGVFRELSTSGLRLWGEWPLPRTGCPRARIWWAITPTPVILAACLGTHLRVPPSRPLALSSTRLPGTFPTPAAQGVPGRAAPVD